ncbi:MAG: F0F1 ATP synthase subunit epsilon [Planctomycetota bacterium]
MSEAKAVPERSFLHLKILLPTEILVEQPVRQILAEGDSGWFCLLPRHIDFVASLVPSVLVFHDEDDAERFVAVDEGVLVKCAGEVLVSTLRGAVGSDLERLRDIVEATYLDLDEHERKARTALSRLEAATLRGFRELQELGHA